LQFDEEGLATCPESGDNYILQTQEVRKNTTETV